MKTAIVGSTGFVGSNLLLSYPFEGRFHSSDVEKAYGTNPDLLVYAGVPAQMYLANKDPAADMDAVRNAAENIRKIAPKKIVLISTAAVYAHPAGLSEDAVIEAGGLPAYGWNRYCLECWVQDNFPDCLIVRLPALFGPYLKKNFIYDYIHVIPKMLSAEKYQELSNADRRIRDAYTPSKNGFYICRDMPGGELELLKEAFRSVHFTALNFTDSRSKYQFYNLRHLWNHICRALELGIRKINLVTEPVEVRELYRYLTGDDFNNILDAKPYDYDLRTKHYEAFGGKDGYLYDKAYVLKEIKDFVGGERA